MRLTTLDICDGVARLALNRPDKRNALNAQLIDEMTDALRRAETRARVVVISGEGKAFCAGADLKAVAALASEADYRGHAERMGGLFQTLSDLAIVSMTVVTGPALGAGCGLVCSGDFCIAGPDARFGFPELGKGVLPALVVPPLVAVVGERRALHLLCSETPIDAAQALGLGIVSQVSQDPERAAGALARQVAAIPPRQMDRIRHLIRAAGSGPASEAWRLATEANVTDRLARDARIP